jgi:hypothetical protein
MYGGSNNTSSQKRAELLLVSFSSLLSSASANGVTHALLPPGDPTRSLSNLISPYAKRCTNDGDNQAKPSGKNSGGCCSFPGLKLKSDESASKRASQNVSLVEIMALNLATHIPADRSSVDKIPNMLLTSTASSFKELIDSRLKVSIQALIRTMLKLGDSSHEARVLRRLLTSTNPVQITAVVTSFTLIPKESMNSISSTTNTTIMPIVFETIFDLKIFGKIYTVTIKAPGTISASLNPMDYLLNGINVAFDTMAFLRNMMQQARAIVKKAINRAANITSTVANLGMKNPTPKSNSSERDSTSKAAPSPDRPKSGRDLLESYPEHLRETVRHFLPSAEATNEISTRGLPPNLMKTLKSLAGGEGSETSSIDGSESPTQPLHQGLFSWMQNDSMMAQRRDSNSVGSNNSQQRKPSPPSALNQNKKRQFYSSSSSEGSDPKLSPRKKKVSFSLPNQF